MSQRQTKNLYWQDAPLPREQLVLFQESLESRIPDDHPVRLLDEILDGLDWSAWEAKYHGSRGQPPIHPSVMCKILLFALIRRVRSSRQIEYQLKHSIDFMWLASGRTIDHSTLSAFRRDHQKALKDIYKQMVQVALDLKVAKLSELCIDGTRVLANANRYRRWTQKSVLEVLGQLEESISNALTDLEQADEIDNLLDDDSTCGDKLPAALADKIARRAELKEVLTALQEMDAARKAKGRGDRPAQIPRTDTDARILPNKEGGYAANYTPVAVTETENGFIVEADVVIGNVEHTLLLPMAEQVDELPLKPQTKRFDRSAFIYDEAADCYYCPEGKRLDLERSQTVNRNGTPVEQSTYRCHDCAACPLAAKCKTKPDSETGRSVNHDEYEPERRRHRARMESEKSQARYRKRLHFGKTPFAVLKAALDMRRFLLRGLEGVQTEWLWGCTAFNLKKLISIEGAMRAEKRIDP
jgi:transposase